MNAHAAGTESPSSGAPNAAPAALAGWRWVVHVEEIFFSVVLALLIVVGALPIAARVFELGSFPWAGPLAKQSVLWIALFGASAATRDRKHIRIDALGPLLPARARAWLSALTHAIAAAVCAWLLVPAVQSVTDEANGAFTGDPPSPVFGLPEAWLAAVIPIGLAILTVRLSLAAWIDACSARRGEAPVEIR